MFRHVDALGKGILILPVPAVSSSQLWKDIHKSFWTVLTPEQREDLT